MSAIDIDLGKRTWLLPSKPFWLCIPVSPVAVYKGTVYLFPYYGEANLQSLTCINALVITGLFHFGLKALCALQPAARIARMCLTMWCEIYRSRNKTGAYLYIKEEGDFSSVPEPLKKLLGQLDHVMRLELLVERTLAQADVNEVRRNIAEKGFFLQLPPNTYHQA